MVQADGLILAGGKSRRMGGIHKGSLACGDATFTQILAGELKRKVQGVWLSYGGEIRECPDDCRVVKDIYKGCGPIGGLHAGLRRSENDWLFVAACDMPFLRIELFLYLYEKMVRKGVKKPLYDGVVPVTSKRIHPLSSVYRKNVAEVLEEQIKDHNYCLRDALGRLDILYVDVTEKKEFVQMLRNINTPEDYETVSDFNHTGKDRRTKNE